MHPAVLVSLVSAIACTAFAAAIQARDAQHPANRCSALLLFGAGFWAFCEVVWNSAGDAATALRFVRLSTLGWAWFGPLVLHLFAEMGGPPSRRLRRVIRAAYAVSATIVVTALTTPWIHRGVVREPWGWAYQVGPAFAAYYGFALTCIGLGIWLGVRALRSAPSPAERRQLPWLLAAMTAPIGVASTTDTILPILHVQVVHLGTASFVVLGALIFWSFHRYGHSPLAPGALSGDVLERLPVGVALVSLDGVVRRVNQGLAELVGEPSARLIGRRFGEMVPEAALRVDAALSEVECELQPRSGTPIPVGVCASLLRDRQNLPLAIVCVVRDRREVTALRSRLVQSGRLAAVGQLAAGIAHEINNPLAFVGSNLRLLREHWAEIGSAWSKERPAAQYESTLVEGEQLLAEALEGVDRAARIVRDVKRFSHAGNGQREHTNLNAVLDHALRVASAQLRDPIVIERRYARLPLVLCEPQEIEQVFLNLLMNAAQAVRGRGRIEIETELERDAVVVSISDDGVGVASEHLERVFDPFFTTKPVGHGTGLGLAISYEIVRRHGGDIHLEPRCDGGTRASVRLPLASALEREHAGRSTQGGK